MERYNSLAQGLNQLAFIGSIIGGFTLTLTAAIISKSEKNRAASWTLGFAVSVTACMLICVIGWSMAAFRLHLLFSSNYFDKLEKMGYRIDSISQYLGLLFLTGIFLFFITLGISGWNISRKLGLITSTIAAIAAIVGWFVIIPFLGSVD